MSDFASTEICLTTLRRRFFGVFSIQPPNIASIDIVIQLEVAVRIVAPPGRRDYGYLSTLCQFFAKPEIVYKIPPGAFAPPPRVTSALVHMTLPGERATLGIRDESRFLEFLQRCFAQKRKTLRNNLRELFSDEQIAEALKSCGLNSRCARRAIEFEAVRRTLRGNCRANSFAPNG